MKPLEWLGDSLDRVRSFPADARREAGYQLRRIQAGLPPANWKPMPSVGAGVQELRLRVRGAFRVIFIARFEEAVYVLHAFQKKSRKTMRLDLEVARARVSRLSIERRR